MKLMTTFLALMTFGQVAFADDTFFCAVRYENHRATFVSTYIHEGNKKSPEDACIKAYKTCRMVAKERERTGEVGACTMIAKGTNSELFKDSAALLKELISEDTPH